MENKSYYGWVTIAKEGRVTPAYRLWFSEELLYRIKSVFLMSYMRDIEARLRKEKRINIEDEIPFWEFLDIEYDNDNKTFYFNAYYTQKPNFPELFERLIGSPKLHKIDDELDNKGLFRIYKQDWKSREELDSELEIENVLYFLIDTKKKLLYIGEASRLVKKLKQEHCGIENWDYYRYNVLPDQLSKHRVQFERMLIRDFVALLDNSKGLGKFNISEYKLVNDKIDFK